MTLRRALLLACLFLGACQSLSGSRLTQVVSEAPVTGQFNKLVIAGIDTTLPQQRAMEVAVVKAFASTQRQAYAMSDLLPDAARLNQSPLLMRLKKQGATAVLVTRFMGYDTAAMPKKADDARFQLAVPSRTPTARVGWESDAVVAGSSPLGMTTAMMPSEFPALLETRLYDVSSGRVLWQANSRVFLDRESAQQFQGFARLIVKALSDKGWK